MNRRRDDLRALLIGSAPAPAAEAPPAPEATPRAASGAVKAMGLSLSQRAREAEETARTLEETQAALTRLQADIAAGARVVELDPGLVDPSFAADRFELEPAEGAADPAFAAFIEDMRVHGQQVPVLVRPNPGAEGRFQLAYGHRRWRAARALGQRLRAVVKPLSDADLVVAQGQENAQRRDLSFIEKAFFALSLDDKGFDRATLCAALAVQSAEISRLLAVARAVPPRLVAAIGAAPKAGRPRWLALVDALAQPRAQTRIDRVLADSAFRRAESDTRFSMVFEALSQPAPIEAPQVVLRTPGGAPLARLDTRGREARLVIDTARAPDFAALIAERLPALYAEWAQARGADPSTQKT
ncbi:MAG: plasmid partitioning protein RepB [Proteobacteria bacterium]|nr:plasmid partitioning protein RepB [Pseudomonadota bacterium]